MAEPKKEKIEEKVEETDAPKDDGELSDADVEKVSGSLLAGVTAKGTRSSTCTFCACD
jgi:rRNA maturation endonuclease Nob1